MRGPARHSAEESYFDSDDEFAFGALSANERITPVRGRRGGSVLRIYLAALVLIGGGWAMLGHQEQMQPWVASVTAAIGPLLEKARTAIAEATTPTVALAPSPAADHTGGDPWAAKLAPLPASEVAAAPGASAGSPPAAPEQQTSNASAAHDNPPTSAAADAAAPAKAGSADAQPLPPPPPAESLTPYQKRATAVGLNPDLSKVLLQRLSPADFRNAGVAIRTALAKTPDDGVFVWPRQRKPELALFEVHFVAGAAPNCRRYVVTVTKDRWSTTALPMERCGAGLATLRG